MSEQWVIGRYVSGRWLWLSLGAVESFTVEVDRAERFQSFKKARAVHNKADGECILTLKAAQAIVERWAK